MYKRANHIHKRAHLAVQREAKKQRASYPTSAHDVVTQASTYIRTWSRSLEFVFSSLWVYSNTCFFKRILSCLFCSNFSPLFIYIFSKRCLLLERWWGSDNNFWINTDKKYIFMKILDLWIINTVGLWNKSC